MRFKPTQNNDISIKPPRVLINGRQMFDAAHLFEEIARISLHSRQFDCSFANINFIREERRGMKNVYHLMFNMCGIIEKLHSEKTSEENSYMNSNMAWVNSMLLTGQSYSQLKVITSTLDMPCMAKETFNKCQKKLSSVIHDVAWQRMEAAAKEEGRLAIAAGDVDIDGVPLVTVVTDGAWCKRSFGSNYDALSGVLEGSYQLCDFNINLNDVVQVMEKQVVDPSSSGTLNMDSAEETSKSEDKIEWIPAESKYYTVGDLVDVKETDRGSWVEASILNIYKDPQYLLEETPNNDGRIYCVRRLIVDEIVDCFVSLGEIRPRARIVLQFEDLHVGDIVMVNYNEEDPKARGHWYDLTVQHLDTVKRKKVVSGTLHFTRESYLNNITITFSDEIMRIEENKLREEMTEEEKELMHTHIDFRPRAPICSKCCDHPRRRCRACSCYLCGGKDDPEKQILCDECDQAYHLGCLDPPLVNLPEMDEWYCPECKNDENEIVRAGGKLKESKRKSMAASKTTSSKRDWGKGMACVGRTKVCTIVPPDHFGPVPGVEVGTSWMFRMQASEAGIHRPHVAGIHGREDRGAFSIVLSGGYEDDVDNGDEFWYTGSGGRDLSGNKRTAAQSSDQKLTRMNRALALNCNAPINEQKGSESKDWKKGKPVRVIRSSKLAKHSTYAPSKGNRYDGIYKVVKYYPEKGKAGFIVWRYVLRRDDPTFAPWTKEGKERINRLGLKLQYPENYLEAMASKEKTEGKKTPKAIESHKRKRLSSRNSEENIEVHEVKKVRPEPHSLEKDLAKLIDQDINTKLWGECKKHLIEGTQKFLENVMEQFLCICCQDLVFEPVTTECLHTFCKRCLHRSFAAQVYTCPCCRTELGKDYEMEINEPLSQILVKMFPGYTAGRN